MLSNTYSTTKYQALLSKIPFAKPILKPKSFFDADDFFIIMDHYNINGRTLNNDELKQLRDIGIKIMFMSWNPWSEREKKFGEINWDPIDEYINRARKNGMKIILPVCTNHLYCAPTEWYAVKDNGDQNGVIGTTTLVSKWGNLSGKALSPWCPDAVNYMLNYYQKYVDRYSSNDVLIINTQIEHGESFWCRNNYACYDKWAKTNFEKFKGPIHDWAKTTLFNLLIRQQDVLSKQQNKIIHIAHHPLVSYFSKNIAYIPDNNDESVICEILTAYKAIFAEHDIFWIIYTWNTWKSFDRKFSNIVTNIKNKHNVRIFAGSGWCEGLPKSTPIAIKFGINGHITSPIHVFTKHKKLEKWMLDNLKASLDKWKKAKLST